MISGEEAIHSYCALGREKRSKQAEENSGSSVTFVEKPKCKVCEKFFSGETPIAISGKPKYFSIASAVKRPWWKKRTVDD